MRNPSGPLALSFGNENPTFFISCIDIGSTSGHRKWGLGALLGTDLENLEMGYLG
jgi:hypothetical protein